MKDCIIAFDSLFFAMIPFFCVLLYHYCSIWSYENSIILFWLEKTLTIFLWKRKKITRMCLI